MKRIVLSCTAAVAAACLMTTAAAGADAVVYYPHTGQIKSATKLASHGKSLPISKTLKSPGGITWNITYMDGAGVGFNDASLGAARKATLDAVLVYIDSVLDETGTCDIEVEVSENDASGFLASCGSLYPVSNGFFGGASFQHITTGTDPFGGNPDMAMTVDFGYAWHLGTGSIPVSPTQFDFYSVLLHEITHGLGIASLTTSTGASQFQTPFATSTFTTWDELLHQISGATRVWSTSQVFQASTLAGGDNTIDFRGSATATTFGGFPPIYTPSSFTAGSSVSHWQFNTPISPDSVMRHAIVNNTENRTYEPFEISALQDLGYTIAVSEVGGWMSY